MKALVMTAFGKVEMQERAWPEPAAGDVRVRVEATGICGSDVHGFQGHQARRQPGLVLGHETTGVVDGVGSGVPESWIGKRVAVNPLLTCETCAACRSGRQNVCETWRLLGMDHTAGGFAEAVAVPVRNVTLLPDHVTATQAVLIEPIANAIHILSMIPVSAGSFPSVAIIGGGTLGACILSVAKARGFRVRLVVERNAARGLVMQQLGAESVRATLEDAPVGEFPVVVDAVGIAVTRQAALRLVARGGTVLLLGLDEGPTELNFQDIVRREIRLQGSFAYTATDFAAAVEFVASPAFDLSAWTDSVPLEDAQAAFEKLINNPGDRLKIALIP